MRLLIVNPNTSAGVTARIREAADAIALPGDRFTTVSAAFGPELIVTEADARHAMEGVKAAVRNHRDALDGVVLASFGDTGAAEVRGLLPGVPVIGIASAAFAAARTLGGRFGIVTFGTALAPALRRKADELGMGAALLGVAAIEGGDQGDPGTVQARLYRELTNLCQNMASEGAASIILGGGPLAGLARRIGPLVPVPVIDGTQAAVGLMRAVADQKTRKEPAEQNAAG